MNTRRTKAILASVSLLCMFTCPSPAQPRRDREGRAVREMTQILGRPANRSVTLSVLAPDGLDVFVEYGTKPGAYKHRTKEDRLSSSKPLEILVDALRPDTRYYYRLNHRRGGESSYTWGAEYSFHTQRAPGGTFTFAVQGDSHPERLNRMYHPDLYVRTLENVQLDRPDFYIALGDDFSPEHLFNRNILNADTVAQLYIDQRNFLGLAGRTVPLFLVNGNHEQAAKYLLDGTPNSVPVVTGKARNLYYPLPAPDRFYAGDAEPVEFVGLPRDYYAWTWGDALFVTMDPYWHSPVQIDSGLGGRRGNDDGGRRNRDGWAATMGDAQYHWLKHTLEQSKAKYKFIFAHHVLGTGRGAVEMADLYEWGGRNRNGEWEFDKKRPGWELPVHQLVVKHGVTIFFQGHDHLFARQEKDGVVYQEAPNPADTTYSAFNREAYRSGDIFPNSGYLRVTVSPAHVKVDYVRSYLPKDETPERKNGEVAFSYMTAPRKKAQ